MVSLVKRVLGNLAFDFGLLLFLAAMVSILSLFGLRRIRADYKELVEHTFEIERLTARIEIDLLRAVELEEQFLLQLEHEGFEAAAEKYLVPHQEFTDNLEDDIAQLMDLVKDHKVLGDEEIEKNLNQLKEKVNRYEANYELLIQDVEKRGTLESGLEGNFRNRAAYVDNLISSHGNHFEMHYTLCKMRFHEEEYLLVRDPKLAETVNLWYHDLAIQVQESDLPRAEIATISYELEFYDNEFLDVVEIDQEIDRLHSEIRELVDEISYIAEDIDRIAREEAARDLDDADKVARQTIQLVTMSVVVILVFGLGLALAMSFQMRKGDE